MFAYFLCIDEKCLVYPRHFEVRFAEHICQLLKAVMHQGMYGLLFLRKILEKVEKLILNRLLGFVRSGGKDQDRYQTVSVCEL